MLRDNVKKGDHLAVVTGLNNVEPVDVVQVNTVGKTGRLFVTSLKKNKKLQFDEFGYAKGNNNYGHLRILNEGETAEGILERAKQIETDRAAQYRSVQEARQAQIEAEQAAKMKMAVLHLAAAGSHKIHMVSTSMGTMYILEILGLNNPMVFAATIEHSTDSWNGSTSWGAKISFFKGGSTSLYNLPDGSAETTLLHVMLTWCYFNTDEGTITARRD